MPILEQGVYDNIETSAYHGRCTPEAALTSSVAKILAHKCEYAAWWASELNPDREEEQASRFDIGTAAHLAVLQPKRMADKVVVLNYPDFKTKAAREHRDGVYMAGKTPLLEHQLAQVEGMRKAFAGHPDTRNLFSVGEAEQTIVWFDQKHEIWCKARPDWWCHDIADIKSVPSCAEPDLQRIIWQHHWYQQAAWYLEGAKAIGRAVDEFVFCAIEKEAPHLIVAAPMDQQALAWGFQLNDFAKRRWARCLKSGVWPGYDRVTIGLPGWAHFQLERRREFGEFSDSNRRITQAQRESADRAQRPLDYDPGGETDEFEAQTDAEERNDQ